MKGDTNGASSINEETNNTERGKVDPEIPLPT